MQKDDFQLIATLLKKRSGLDLTEDKTYLIESRLLPVARGQKLANIAELCARLRGNPGEELLTEITEAMTTNESSFFRDIKPYEQLRQAILPMLMQKLSGQRRMRIWSAACSTGQEPYTIAMCLLEEAVKTGSWDFDIIASDLARKVLDKAEQGVYSQFEVQRGMPIQLLLKYFDSLPDTNWRLKDRVRGMVQFRPQNLLEDYSALGKLDLIFCRNVLIYFDESTKVQITARMAQALSPHGVLILGATETLVDPQDKFVALPDLRGAYCLKG